MSPAAVEAILHDFANRATRLGAARHDGSEVWRFEVDGHVYHLHYYPEDDTLLRRRLGGSDAAREFAQLQSLQKLGVPATRVIANLKGFRIADRKGDACIVVHDENVIPLPSLASALATMAWAERARLIAGVMQRLEELHRHRMVPRPLRLSIFGRRGDGTIAIIDATGRMNGLVEPDRLHELDGSTRHLTSRSQRATLWKHFTDETSPRNERGLTRSSARLVRDSDAGEGEDFGSFEHDGWHGTFVRQVPFALPWSGANDLVFDADGWRAAMPTLLEPEASGWTMFKRDAAARVFGGRWTFPDTHEPTRTLELVVKRPATPTGFGGLLKRLRPSRARRAWIKTWRLLSLGFACEVPLLLLERRIGPTWTEQVGVFERVPGPTLAQVRLDDLPADARANLLADCGRTMGRIERAGFGHQDAKNTNWIAWTDASKRPHAVLIDCDGVRRFVPKGRAMPRFVRSMKLKPEFNDQDLARVEEGFNRGSAAW